MARFFSSLSSFKSWKKEERSCGINSIFGGPVAALRNSSPGGPAVRQVRAQSCWAWTVKLHPPKDGLRLQSRYPSRPGDELEIAGELTFATITRDAGPPRLDSSLRFIDIKTLCLKKPSASQPFASRATKGSTASVCPGCTRQSEAQPGPSRKAHKAPCPGRGSPIGRSRQR